VIQEVVVDRAVEDHDPDLLISLQSSHDFLELLDHYRPMTLIGGLSIVTANRLATVVPGESVPGPQVRSSV